MKPPADDESPFLLSKTDDDCVNTILKNGSPDNRRGFFFEDDCGVLVDKRMRCHTIAPSRLDAMMSFVPILISFFALLWLYHVHFKFNQLLCLIVTSVICVNAIAIASMRWNACKTSRAEFYLVMGGFVGWFLLTFLDQFDMGPTFAKDSYLIRVAKWHGAASPSASPEASSSSAPSAGTGA